MENYLPIAGRIANALFIFIGVSLCLLSTIDIGWEIYRHGPHLSCHVRTSIVAILFGFGFLLVPLTIRKLLALQNSKQDKNALYRMTPLFFLAAYVYLLASCGGILCQQSRPSHAVILNHL